MSKNDVVNEAVDLLCNDIWASAPINSEKDIENDLKQYWNSGRKVLVKYGNEYPLTKIGFCGGKHNGDFAVKGNTWKFIQPLPKKEGTILLKRLEFHKKYNLFVFWGLLTGALAILVLSIVFSFITSAWFLMASTLIAPTVVAAYREWFLYIGEDD